jgi:endogenous inhibitor of DNA gyrase (YacG/DUF329 family)
MPRWLVICPECRRTFTHTVVDAAFLEQANRDPFHVLPRPDKEKRKCPHCGMESVFESQRLFYARDAGQT